jgi:hypothetical protein
MKNFSTFLGLNSQDLLKGFIVAVITSVLGTVYQWVSDTPPHFPTVEELKNVGLVALAAGISYLIKNLFSNSAGEPLKTEASPAAKKARSLKTK